MSRATAYRRWPNRSDFLRHVLLRVVHDAQLEPESDADIAAVRDRIAASRDSLMAGLVGRAAIVPTEPAARMRAFGSAEESPWTTQSYAITSAVLSFVEPDPKA